jgi:Na+/proline symporter
MGILIAPAVFPVAATLMWKKQTSTGAIAGAVGGLICGVSAWLGVAQSYYGYINLDSSELLNGRVRMTAELTIFCFTQLAAITRCLPAIWSPCSAAQSSQSSFL